MKFDGWPSPTIPISVDGNYTGHEQLEAVFSREHEFRLLELFNVQFPLVKSALVNLAFSLIQPKTVGSKVTELMSGNCISCSWLRQLTKAPGMHPTGDESERKRRSYNEKTS
jgi:hypothetical protein